MEKILDGINVLDDKTLLDHIELSYKIYKSESKEPKNAKFNIKEISNKYNQVILSSLVRFFRYINNSLYIDSETLKEILKSRTLSYSLITEKLNEVLSYQNKRIYITDTFYKENHNETTYSPSINSQIRYSHESVKYISGISWRINLIISNSDMNKVLIPQVIIVFTYEDSSMERFIVPINVFQEMRKNMTKHLKKIIENDHVSLLNN